MAIDISQMNARSWETLVLSMLKSDLLRTTGTIPYQKHIFNRQQQNNYIINSAVDGILLHKTEKLSAVKRSPENGDSDFDENKIYHIDNMSIEYTKEKLE